MFRAVKPCLALALAAAAACGPGDDAGDGPREGDPPPPDAASCTGAVPANATMCAGADAGLAADAPRVVTGSCDGAAPCAYACNPGFVVTGGACVSVPSAPAEFTDNGDGTVTVSDAVDHLTWLRLANCQEAVTVGDRTVAGWTGTWDEATAWSAGLTDGVCGLRDGSAPGDWRLPTHVELTRLALQLGDVNPFLPVESGHYWSSWTYWPDKAGAVQLLGGEYFDFPRTSRFYMWPVR